MIWLEMTRGNRPPGRLPGAQGPLAPAQSGRPVAWLALMVLVWPSAVVRGQMLEWPQAIPPPFEPLLSESPQEPSLERYVVPEPRVAPIASAVSHGSYAEPVANRFAGGTGPDGGGLAARYPDDGGACPGPAVGVHPRCTNPRFGYLPLLHQDLGGCRRLGRPVQRESWLYRPFSAGWFMGMVQGSPLIDDWVGQQQGFFGGYRFGWDHDPYWGGEMRFAFGSVELFDSQRAKDAQQAADTAAGLAEDDPWRQRFNARRDADLFQWDLSALYYPWGETQWRPYLMVGLGSARVRFIDRLSEHFDKVMFAMPLAVGVKYRCDDWLALRFECTDNIAFGGGGGLNTLHNFSVTGGVEVRFGGSRRAYWPWNPGRHYW